jgi:hypothetical protein
MAPTEIGQSILVDLEAEMSDHRSNLTERSGSPAAAAG